MRKRKNTVRVIALIALAGAIAAIYATPAREYLTLANVRAAASYLEGLWFGPIAFIASYAIGAVLLLPATLFVVAAGVIWGWKLGSLYALAGGTLGAVVSYLAGNFLAGGILDRFGGRMARLSAALKGAGFQTLLLLRLVGVIPFGIYNYGAGVAHVNFRNYILSTIAGLVPATLVMSYSADALLSGSLSSRDALYRILGVATALFSFVLLTAYLKKRFARSGGVALVVEEEEARS